MLAVFSVPESERAEAARPALPRLAGLGLRHRAPGVWIAPARLYAESRHTLGRLGLDTYVDFFRGEHLGFAPTAEAVTRWWDLAAIAKEHEAFLDRHARVLHDWSAARTRRPRRPTATTSSPWTPGATCPTRTRAARPAAARRLARHALGGRLPGAARAARGIAEGAQFAAQMGPVTPTRRESTAHSRRDKGTLRPPQTLFSGFLLITVRTHESHAQLEPGPHRHHRPPGTESTPGGHGESEGDAGEAGPPPRSARGGRRPPTDVRRARS